jgi:hypothetical protein
MDNNKKNNATDTTNKQNSNRTEFAEDCHNNTSNNTSKNNKNK